MTRSSSRVLFAGAVLVSTLAATMLSDGALASTLPGRQTMVGRHPVVYNDRFSGPAQYRTDQELGIKTHWEGLLNLSDPTSPLQWTRVEDSAATASGGGTWTGGVQPAMQSHSRTGIRPRSLPYTDCSPGSGSGGIRLWEQVNNTGNCVRFTGIGSQSLAGFAYPNSCDWRGANCHYADHSQSLGTQGSTGSGHLSCAGGDWHFSSNSLYQNLLTSSGSANCDGSKGYVYVLYSGS